MVESVTILVRYENEKGDQGTSYHGFLTVIGHAIYVENTTPTSHLRFVTVTNADKEHVYLQTSDTYCSLGELNETQCAEDRAVQHERI